MNHLTDQSTLHAPLALAPASRQGRVMAVWLTAGAKEVAEPGMSGEVNP